MTGRLLVWVRRHRDNPAVPGWEDDDRAVTEVIAAVPAGPFGYRATMATLASAAEEPAGRHAAGTPLPVDRQVARRYSEACRAADVRADLDGLGIFRAAVHSVFARQETARGNRPADGTGWQAWYAACFRDRTALPAGVPAADFGIAGPARAAHAQARAELAGDLAVRLQKMGHAG